MYRYIDPSFHMQLGNWDPQNKVRYISAHQYPDMVKQLFQTSFATEVDPILIYDIVCTFV